VTGGRVIRWCGGGCLVSGGVATNHTSDQVIIRSDKVRTFTLTEGGEVWLSVPGLAPGAGVVVPPATTVTPAGALRVILRGGLVEVHYQVEDTAVRSARRGCGTGTVGVDKGYSEVLVDSDGDHHGPSWVSCCGQPRHRHKTAGGSAGGNSGSAR
jgi:hypothetical protein